VKFLIDRCAGHRLAEWLRAQGHDVVESRDRGPDPGDRVLLEWAGAEDRTLVTMDKDFGVFIFLDKAPHCGIIRLPDVPADRRIQLMKKVLKRPLHRVAQSGYCHREGRANPGVPRFVNTYLRSIGRVVGVRRAHPNLPCLPPG
jgi:predicted nuclease of predicted toxin-antitoxin system